MSLTPDGVGVLAELVATHLQGGSIEVSDGNGRSASRVIESIALEGELATVAVTFATGEGNFDWRVRRVLDADGVILDEDTGDWGRKSPDREWTMEVPITLEAP